MQDEQKKNILKLIEWDEMVEKKFNMIQSKIKGK